MSDSDDDLLQSNVFTFQNENTTICAKGPNVNNMNITGLGFHNNFLSLTQKYARSNFDQRSVRYGREMSPMSLRSARDYRLRDFNRSTIRPGTGIHRPLHSGRGGSPATVRSIDSTASVSAADIVFAFKNVRFDNHDLKTIKEAFNMLMKTRHRKRVEKRRNHRLLMKRNHRNSGEDSGEQGSDSSISSDDCRSIKTTNSIKNIHRLSHMRDLAHLSRNMRENQMLRDCSESIKQNSVRNMFSINTSTSNYGTREGKKNAHAIDLSQSSTKVHNTSIMTQKERFNKGFLLPSQRFNRTIGQTQMSEKDEIIINGNINKINPATEKTGSPSDSDSEEIFRRFSKNPQQALNVQKKRTLEIDDVHHSNNKRSKLGSPKMLRNTKNMDSALETGTNSKSDDYIFAKPKMPIKKMHTKVGLGPEKLLARSKVPIITEENDFDFIRDNKSNSNEQENNEETVNVKQPDPPQSTDDVSMRPSFIKRKLFTQKLDVTENKNLSCDSIPANSPQNVYTASMRERNKTRKLVVSQSCLSREVPTEDNNILDLIHKIVPANQINVTNGTNKAELSNRSINVDNSEKWDVTTAISNCNNQDTSDTYTDEEIFSVTYNRNLTNTKTMPKKITENGNGGAQCKVVVEKLNSKILYEGLKTDNFKFPKLNSPCKEKSKKNVTNCVKSFWDTDFESDMELRNDTNSWKKNAQKFGESAHEKTKPEVKQKNRIKVAPVSKGTVLTVRNCYRDPQLNISVKFQKNHLAEDKSVVENVESSSVVQDKVGISKVGITVNKPCNKKLCTDKKYNNGKENVPVTKQQDSGRKSKAKKAVDCLNDDKNTDTPKRSNRNARLRDNSKEKTKTSNENKELPVKVTSKNKSKQPKQCTSNKTAKSSQNKDAKIQKQITNVRIQPKRKSKENSFTKSCQPSTKSNNTKTYNAKSKTNKQLSTENTSLNSINTRCTRSSRDKQSFDCSMFDHSSVNISNISSRSLRFRQRRINELHKSRL